MQPTDSSLNDPVAEILEQCRVRLARGETTESCLAAYPDHADELRELLPLAARVPYGALASAAVGLMPAWTRRPLGIPYSEIRASIEPDADPGGDLSREPDVLAG